MKKLAILIMTGVIIGTGYMVVSGHYKVIDKQEQKQLEQYKQQEVRAVELQKKQNPTIVLNELKRVGKLTVLEGQMQYQTNIKDTGIMDITLREMTLDLTYQFGVCMPLEYIKVKQITDDRTIYLQIPKNRMQLQYIQLNAEKSRIITGKKMILVSQFNPSDVGVVIEQSQQTVVNKIGNDRQYFDKAMINLKDELGNIIKPLGFNNIQFEEV